MSLTLKVKAGDALRFVLDRSSDPDSAILAWMPRISYQEKTGPQHLDTVRILCGARKNYTDRNGNKWSADSYFRGGEPMENPVAIEGARPTAQDEPLYQRGRHGKDFSYAIPTQGRGLYSIRLKFAEPENMSGPSRGP